MAENSKELPEEPAVLDEDGEGGPLPAEPPPDEEQELPYFILHGKDADGPYMPQEICNQMVVGRLTPSSYCWNQSMVEWMPLREVFDFAAQPGMIEDDGRTPPLARFGRRFAAGTIDLVSIIFLFELTMLLVPPFRGWVEVASVDPAQLVTVNLIIGALVYLYFLLALGPPGAGATLGYRLCGLRLVDQASRRHPGWMQSLLWCLGSISLPVGWPFYWFDRQRRMLHNGISQTLVLQISGGEADDIQKSEILIGPGTFGLRLAALRERVRARRR